MKKFSKTKQSGKKFGKVKNAPSKFRKNRYIEEAKSGGPAFPTEYLNRVNSSNRSRESLDQLAASR